MTRMCRCGMEWETYDHRLAVERSWAQRWRGNIGQLIPYRVWVKENLPRGKSGCVNAGDDGFVRTFGPDNDLGYVVPVEVKTMGRGLDDATRLTLTALEHGRATPAVLVRMWGGNVPSELAHWPDPCICGLPEPPVVADHIDVSLAAGRSAILPVDASQLRHYLLNPFDLMGQLLGRRYA